MKLSAVALLAFVSVWIIAVSSMALRSTLVNTGDSYETALKWFSAASIAVGALAILFVFSGFYWKSWVRRQ